MNGEVNPLRSSGATADLYDDGVTSPSATFVSGGMYTLPSVACSGTGYVRGWIDWNLNGVFDSGEASGIVACTAGSAGLTWTVPSDAKGGSSYLRLWIAPTSAELAAPTGMSSAGEVEDYAFPVTDETPQLTKSWTSTNTVGDSATLAFTIANGPDLAAKAGLSFTDALPAGAAVSGTATVSCTNGSGGTVATSMTVTGAVGATSVTVSGTLPAGTAQCLVSVPVTAPAGSYVNGPSNISGVSSNLTSDVVASTATWAAPTDGPETATTPLNTAVTIDPFANFAPVAGDPSPTTSDTTTFAFSNGLTAITTAEGAWTYDSATNRVTFAPATGYSGVTPPMPYSYKDSNGNVVSSTATVTVAGDVVDLSGTGAQGTAVTVPLTGQSSGIDPTTVELVTPTTGALVTSFTVAGEGAWSVNPVTGAMTFTPQAGFQGDPTLVRYTATNASGELVAPATVTVTYPDVSDVSGTGAQGSPVTVAPVLDAQALPTTVKLVGPLGARVTTLTVAGEGVWTVDATTGAMTFTPETGFQGDPTPAQYTAADAAGHAALPATVTVTYPDVSDLSGTGDQGSPVTVAPALEPGMVAATVRLLDPGAGALVSSLTVSGEGVWTVDSVTGAMTFTPAAGFQGDPTPVQYTAADASGDLALPATVTVSYPNVSDVSGTGPQGSPVTVAPMLDAQAVPATVRLVNPGTGALVTTLTVAGQGVWSVDPTTGAMTFTPEAGFQGDPTPVRYTAADATGHLALSATVTVTYPDVSDVAGTGAQGSPVTVAAALKPGMDLTTVRLVDPSGSLVTWLTVAGQGVWTVDSVTGSMTFTPEAGYQGDPTPVQYTASDASGDLALPATVTVTYPNVSDVAGTGAQGSPVRVPLSGQSAGIDPTTVKLIGPLGALVTTLTVAGEGVWTVDSVTGAMTFTPETGFQADPTPVSYTAADSLGDLALPATVTVTYPDVSDVSGTGDQGSPVTVAPAMGPGMVPATVRLLDPGTGALVTTVTVSGEGVWTVDPVTGAMTFTPGAGFQGDPTPVQYTAADASGDLALPATVTVTYPDVSDVSRTGAQGSPVTVAPVLDPQAVPATVMLVDPGTGALVPTVTVSGEGVWPTTGAMTFTPETGFQGDPTPVRYTAADAAGHLALSATVTVTYPDVSDVAGTGVQGSPVTVPPVMEPGMDPTTVKLVGALGARVTTLTVAGEGVWTVDPTTGGMTFTPEAGFQGDPTPVQYAASDASGDLALPATVTVSYPDVSDVSGTGPQGSPVTVAPVLDPQAVPATVRLVDPGTGAMVTTLTVGGEGAWTVDPTTGAMTFTPETGLQGDPTPVRYAAADASGHRAIPATVTVSYPDVSDATGATQQGTSVTIPTVLEPGTEPSTVTLVDPATGALVTSATVAGQGTWTVNPDGAVTFAPVPTFTGLASPIQYTANDAAGHAALPATITVTVTGVVPTASPDTAATPPVQPVTICVTCQDSAGSQAIPLDPTSVLLLDPADGHFKKTVTISGEGTYVVNTDGTVTFTPLPGFTGAITPLTYEVADVNGTLATSTLTITVKGGLLGQTGSPVSLAAVAGAGSLLAAGGVLLLIGRRRHESEGAHTS